MNELICHGIPFSYNAQEEAIYADLSEDVKNSFCENIQGTFERVEPTDKELLELYYEVMDILEVNPDSYTDLSEIISATMTYEDGRREETTLKVNIEAIGLEMCDLVFITTNNESYGADHFDKKDQYKVFTQFLKDHEGE